jgi:hypothetical protein
MGNYQASNTFDNVAPGQPFYYCETYKWLYKSTMPFTVDQVVMLVIADGDLNQIKATATGGSRYMSTVLMERISLLKVPTPSTNQEITR